MRAVLVLVLVTSGCWCRSVPEEFSVVSVYTTPATPGTGAGLDVYQQFANNLAEKLTSPIYRFLGINKTTTERSTHRPWDKIELLDEPTDDTTAVKPINNDISDDRDVEELSDEPLKKREQKPEKITLYSNYLPLGRIELVNNTINEIPEEEDDTFGFDEVEGTKGDADDGGYWTYLLELFSGLAQLAWNAFQCLFGSPTNH